MSSKMEQKLAEFRITFIAEYSDKLAMLTKLWLNARTSKTLDAVKKFRFEVHSIRGSSASLNFLALSDLLCLIEEEVAPCEEKINTLNSVIPFIDRHMNTMIEATKNNPNPLLLLKEATSTLSKLREPQKIKEEINSPSYRDIKIALIDDNKNTSVVNAKLLTEFGFTINQFNSIEQFEEVFKQNRFNLVLIDTDNSINLSEKIFDFAAKLKTFDTDVFVLSSSSSFENRLSAVRSKVKEYLLKPVNITTLVSKIRKNFKIDIIRPYRILLLDDQALEGSFYKTLLEDEHVEVLAISQANSIMTELESFHPDVFLLDIHMPNISGLEVAMVLRQQAKYDYVPIIFLTSDDGIKTKLEVLEWC